MQETLDKAVCGISELQEEFDENDSYPNYPHHFQNSRCVNCCWDSTKSSYIKHLEKDRVKRDW